MHQLGPACIHGGAQVAAVCCEGWRRGCYSCKAATPVRGKELLERSAAPSDVCVLPSICCACQGWLKPAQGGANSGRQSLSPAVVCVAVCRCTLPISPAAAAVALIG
jgi:hypothetical protein